jgi:hypothetical protein
MHLNSAFRHKKYFLVLGLTLLFNLILLAQVKERNTGESTHSEFRIPLFAIDTGGNPFYDLKKKDLELYINGKRVETKQLIKYFHPKNIQSQEPIRIENESEAISQNPERSIIIVFDAMFSSNYGVKRARKIATKLVENASSSDSFILLIHSAREGLNPVFGPEKNKEVFINEIKEAKIFPGSKWFKDLFSSRDSFMERFSASSDYKVNEYADPTNTEENTEISFKKAYIQEVEKFSSKVDQIRYAFQMITKPKIIYLFSEGYQDYVLVDKYFDPSIAESPDVEKSSYKFKLENFNFSSIISEYFRKLIMTFKESGSIFYSINPGQLKTMSYDSSGAMHLAYITGRGGKYFQSLNSEKLMDDLLNATAAYFELVSSLEENFGHEQKKIEVKCNKKDVHVYTPILMIEKIYNQMSTDLKKKYAINIVTEGILSRMIGKAKKTAYDKDIEKTEDRLHKCTVEVHPLEKMQRRSTDIFSIALNKKTKEWKVQMTNKIISEREKLTFVLKDKRRYDLYFALINTNTADAIYNKIK